MPIRIHLPRVLCLLMTAAVAGCGTGEPPAPPPLDIPVMPVIQKDTDISLDLVGQTRGSIDVPIRARVQGVLLSRDFREGGFVESGQLLYTIDPAAFQSKVVEAEGYVAEARTLLAKAGSDLDRIRPLAEMDAVSQQDLDGAVAQYDAAVGNLQAAEAQLEQAQIEFGYTRIHSPIDGFIGISIAEVGEFVGAPPNPVVLNYVSLTDPIRVRFSINERDYLRLARTLSAARRTATASEVEDRGQGLKLILADGSIHPYDGHIVAFDAAINPSTGTFTLEADFPNPDDVVLAGQFARVRAIVDSIKGALLVPIKAISELQGLYRVFVVKQDNTVEARTVDLGPQVGRLRVVTAGLSPGEQIAVEGLLRLSDGARVNPQPTDPSVFEQPADTGTTPG